MGSNEVAWTDTEANGTNISFTAHRYSREKKQRIAIIIISIIACALLIALVVVIVTGKKSSPGICLTEGCVRSAANILDSINASVDPCEDFYLFSCGNWMSTHQEDSGIKLIQVKMNEHAKRMKEYLQAEMRNKNKKKFVSTTLDAYVACREYEGFQSKDYTWLTSQINDMGGWPMIDKNWKEGNNDWKSIYINAFQKFYFSVPITLIVNPNPFNTSHNILFLQQSPPTAILQQLELDKVLDFSKTFITRENNDTFHKDVEEIRWLTEHLTNLTTPSENPIEGDKQLITIEELQEMIPEVKWLQFFRNCYKAFMKSTSVITDKTVVFVIGVKYLRRIINELDDGIISTKMLANYAALSFINNMEEYYPPTIDNDVESIFSKRQKRSVKLENGGRWETCIDYIIEVLSPAVDYIHSQHRKEQCIDEKMADYMFKAMSSMVDKTTWLDKETKAEVQEKLVAIIRNICFPPWVYKVSELEEFYRDLPTLSERDPLGNKLKLDSFIMNQMFDVLLTKNDRTKWPKLPGMGASKINAFYDPDRNIIIIPAAIQILPYFDADRPAYMNFGGMGLILGHEMTHGLDKESSEKDKQGNIRNWWSAESKEEFEKRSQCFIDQYNSYHYGDMDITVDGVKTLSENIADNGGIRQAYLAYQNWVKDHGKDKSLPGLEKYSAEQMFFISFGSAWCNSIHPALYVYHAAKDDSHSTERYRVIGSLSNMKEFSDIFKCKSGSPMNRKDKCVIW